MSEKLDNASAAHAAKLELRRNVLTEVSPASVLDLFCGRGEMWRGAWSKADRYVGCDERELDPQDPPRYWCDNRQLLRALDLTQFNVFDVDAYGSPWTQMVVLAARRRWLPGERGAVVITDGSSLRTRFGGRCPGMRQLLGEAVIGERTGMDAALMASKRSFRAWVERSHVRVGKRWQALGDGSGRGGAKMLYTAMVFEGLPDQS